MKRNLITTLFALLMSLSLTAQSSYQPSKANLQSRQAFEEARFGIFIHWGIYSLFAQGEWYMQNANIDYREYAKAANAFYPHGFNAQEWVRVIKNSGAKYLTFTTRHHDSFSMWDTHASSFNIMHTPFHRDILHELADACHEQDLRLHLYYSHLDWSRLDYPQGRTATATRPGRDPKGNYKSYLQFMNTQLTELLTRYGKIGAIWFDGLWDQDQNPSFDWHLPEQYALIHSLQPACLIGNNHHGRPFPGEDIQIFERDVPGENTAGLSGQDITHLPLETCQTMNGMWGYKVQDQNYKSTATLIRLLARTAAKGANLLLNVGPQADGHLPAAAVARLDSMGTWLRTHGDAIYKTRAAGITHGDSLVSTRTDHYIYLHLLSPTLQEISIPLTEKVTHVHDLETDSAVPFRYKKGILTLTVPTIDAVPDHILRLHIRH